LLIISLKKKVAEFVSKSGPFKKRKGLQKELEKLVAGLLVDIIWKKFASAWQLWEKFLMEWGGGGGGVEA
jgi:hypothetical protein